MSKTPLSFIVALILTFLNALIWFAFALIIALGIQPSLPNVPFIRWSMTALSFLAGVVLLSLTILLMKRKHLAFSLMFTALIIESILLIFDDFGLSDMIFLTITLFPIVLLFLNRHWYFKQSKI
jgi:hypothetical protein